MDTKELAEYFMLVRRYTKYELIEIEQINPSANYIQGTMMLRYKKEMDDTDPQNVSVKGIRGNRIDGGTMVFVEDPYPNVRKPVGTGKVTYLLDDELPPDKEDFPNGYLSGAEKGYNLEFLASHYGEAMWTIIDPKWDKIVRERYEAMMKEKAKMISVHKFDKKYAVKNVGTAPDITQISMVPDQGVVDALKTMQERMDGLEKENKELKKKKPGKNWLTPKKPQEDKKEDEQITNFAQ
jgi:hypothetical protein